MRKNPKNDLRERERCTKCKSSFPQFFEIFPIWPTVCETDLRTDVSPDSEQSKWTGAKPRQRTFVSVEQIQDNKDRSGIARVLVLCRSLECARREAAERNSGRTKSGKRGAKRAAGMSLSEGQPRAQRNFKTGRSNFALRCKRTRQNAQYR